MRATHLSPLSLGCSIVSPAILLQASIAAKGTDEQSGRPSSGGSSPSETPSDADRTVQDSTNNVKVRSHWSTQLESLAILTFLN
jgi:hypothetical protein